MPQIPAALYLACHILFRVLALTVTLICLQCLQILYKSPLSGNTKISEFSERNNVERYPLFHFRESSSWVFVVSIMALMCPTFIFGTVVHSGYSSSEQCCVALFHFTCPNVQHQVALIQSCFDVSGLLWVEFKSEHWHGPGDCTSWQLARHLHTMFPLCSSGKKKFGASFYLSDELYDCVWWFEVGTHNWVEDVFQTAICVCFRSTKARFTPTKQLSPLLFAFSQMFKMHALPRSDLTIKRVQI